jgi:hypothetical protein
MISSCCGDLRENTALPSIGAARVPVQVGIRSVKFAASQKVYADKYRKTNAFVLLHLQAISAMVTSGLNRKEVTMPAIAEVRSTVAPNPDPRGCDLPTCPVCADSMVAAEASAYVSDNVISYLWTCDTCGYGFVTKHALRQIACN